VQPWNVADRTVQNQIVFVAAEALRIAAILLQPFMPTKMAQLLDDMGVDESKRDFAHATMRKDLEYGKDPRTFPERGSEASLFPPPIVEE